MSITKQYTVDFTLSEEEAHELTEASRLLKTKPDNLAAKLLHEYLEKTKSYMEDPIWDLISSGNSQRANWSTDHTRKVRSRK